MFRFFNNQPVSVQYRVECCIEPWCKGQDDPREIPPFGREDTPFCIRVSSNQQSKIVDLRSEIASRFRSSEVQKLKGYPFAGRVMVSGTTLGVLYRTMAGGECLEVQRFKGYLLRRGQVGVREISPCGRNDSPSLGYPQICNQQSLICNLKSPPPLHLHIAH